MRKINVLKKWEGLRKYTDKDADKAYGLIVEYFRECESNKRKVYDKKEGAITEICAPIPFTMVGVALSMNIARPTLYEYLKDENEGPLYKVISWARSMCEVNMKEGAAIGVYNPTITIWLARDEHEIRAQDPRTEIKVPGSNNKVIIVAPGEVDSIEEYGCKEDGDE